MTSPCFAEKPDATAMLSLEELGFDNIYSSLPQQFYSRHQPEPLSGQHLIHFNEEAAKYIHLDPAQGARPDFLDMLTAPGQWPGTHPIAMCYAGHQFGQFVPRLGDGRALLLGQVRTACNHRWDLHLKGSGLTLYSRQGDGKAVLRSSIREYLASAALHGLGIPTTQALMLSGSSEEVYRETIETGAMILRMAPSHIRFGTFEYYYYQQRFDDLAVLGQFVVDHYFEELKHQPEPYIRLLETVVDNTARLIAQWQSVGFCHGVMNSDNMSIHGMTIDYGPFGFMDTYRSGHVCNHSDHLGRYAFDRQPGIGLFNLRCFAQALLPLLDEVPEQAVEKATEVLKTYEPAFNRYYLDRKREKLGLKKRQGGDEALYDELLELMEAGNADFTNTFRWLSEPHPLGENLPGPLGRSPGSENWFSRYAARLEREKADPVVRSQRMKAVNPKYVLRNYMAEVAIRAARDDQDFDEIDRIMNLLRHPFDELPGNHRYAADSPDWSAGLAVSCSS